MAAVASAVHSRQMERIAASLQDRARREQADGNYEAAARHWRMRLAFAPHDLAALTSLADALHETAKRPNELFELYRLYERILRADANQSHYRRRLATLLMNGGRFKDAQFHINFLLLSDSQNPQLLRDRGLCQLELGNEEEAAVDLAESLKLAPQDVDTWEGYAYLLADRLGRVGDAHDALDRMVDLNRTTYQVYLIRAGFCRMHGLPAQAALDLLTAFRLSPHEPDVLIAVAEMAYEKEELSRIGLRFDATNLRLQLREALQRRVDKEPVDDDKERADEVKLYEALAVLDLHEENRASARRLIEQGLQRHPDSISLRVLFADLLLEQGQEAEARRELERLTKQKAPDANLSFLRARLAMKAGDWLSASQTLERLGASTIGNPYLQAQLYQSLSRCYQELGHDDRSLDSLRRAVEANPGSSHAVHELARALAARGQFDRALKFYEQLGDIEGIDLERARTMLLRNLRLPAEDRNWTTVHQLLDAAERSGADDVAVQLLRADLLVATGDSVGAENLIRTTMQQHSDIASLPIALADLLRREGQVDAALETLQSARDRLGKSDEILLALIDHWRRQPSAESTAELLRMWEELSDRDVRLWTDIHIALAESLLQSDDDAAKRILDDLQRVRPHNAELWLQAVDHALQKGDRTTIERAIEELRRIEGYDGGYWRLAAAGLCILDHAEGQPDALKRATELLDEAAGQLAGSTRLMLARGEIQALSGDLPGAARWYREAINQGERRPEVIRRCVHLLSATGRDSEAATLLEEFRKTADADLNRELRDVGILIAMRMSQFDQALKLAGESGGTTEKDLHKLLQLAQIQWAAGLLAEAEANFRSVVEIDPSEPRGWIGLVALLHRTGKTSEARDVLDLARRELPAEDSAEPLAACCEILGDIEEAVGLLTAAWDQHPERVRLGWQLARLQLRQEQPQEAEAVLRRVIDRSLPDESTLTANARRTLAQILFTRQNFRDYQEALALADANLATGAEPEDLRLKSRLLAGHPSTERRRQAISLLLELEQRFNSLSVDDRFQLAQLYDSVGDWRRSRQQWVLLMAEDTINADYLAYGVRAMLEHGEKDGPLEHWLEILSRQQPKALRTVELRARLLAAGNQIDAAIKLLKDAGTSAAASPQETAPDDPGGQRLLWAAEMLSELSAECEKKGRTTATVALSAEAEQMYRQLASREPAGHLALARFLGRQMRMDEAFQACEQARQSASEEEVVRVAVDLLRANHALCTPDQRALVRSWIEAEINSQPNSADLCFHLATLANLQGDYDTAIRFYRETLRLNPVSSLARNELAVLLALSENETEEALALLEEALQQSGPLPMLLDTRAMVHLAAGSSQEALDDLKRAIPEQPTPVKYFHLAQAQLQSGNAPLAREAFRQAIVLGLNAESLHTLEQDDFERLKAELL
jgi:tetratricopeptide (TPR) repeat protein